MLAVYEKFRLTTGGKLAHFWAGTISGFVLEFRLCRVAFVGVAYA